MSSVIANVRFQWPKRGRELGVSTKTPPKISSIRPPSDEDKESFLTGLKKAMLAAVTFSSIVPLNDQLPNPQLSVAPSTTHFTAEAKTQQYVQEGT